MSNNFIPKKASENGRLLSLLTNRERAKSVPSLRNDWPCKISPNFALTARLPKSSARNNQKSSIKISIRSKQKIIISKDVPAVQISQSGNLQLKPCLLKDKESFQRISSMSKRSLTHYSNRKSGVFKIQENQDAKSVASIFRNSKIVNKVSQIISNQMNDSLHDRKFQQNWEKVLNKKNLINLQVQDDKNHTSHTNRIKQQGVQKQERSKFKIDFLTFGYIDKVIQNPQLWEKYVHKLQNRNEKYHASLS